jgi:hypothetical protein
VVEERRSGDIDHVDVVAPEKFSDVVNIFDPKTGGRRQRCGLVSAGHSDKFDAFHLGELLKGN